MDPLGAGSKSRSGVLNTAELCYEERHRYGLLSGPIVLKRQDKLIDADRELGILIVASEAIYTLNQEHEDHNFGLRALFSIPPLSPTLSFCA